jgi:TusA-related sulfurtransferase
MLKVYFMSADSPSIIVRASYPICLTETLSESELHSISKLLDLLPVDNINLNDKTDLSKPVLVIKDMVDGRGLACPMPLLKTKGALRSIVAGESLYVVASDQNSQADIMAFCQQSLQTKAASPLLLSINQVTVSDNKAANDKQSKYSVDTIYHFIITKTDSN